jgi:hypothetical protein
MQYFKRARILKLFPFLIDCDIHQVPQLSLQTQVEPNPISCLSNGIRVSHEDPLLEFLRLSGAVHNACNFPSIRGNAG